MAKTIRTFCDVLNAKSKDVDSKLSEYGSYVDDWYDGLTGRKKYILEVTLRFPLVVIMYLWMTCLAPYYNNWLLDAPFLVVRYTGLLFILVRFISSFENLLPFYVATFLVSVSSVVSQYVYWISRSAAEEVCFQDALGPCWSAGDPLWTPTIFAIVLRILCMFHLLYYSVDAVLMVVSLVSSLITLLMCSTSWYIVAEVDYLANGFFLILSLLMIYVRCEENDESSVNKKLTKLRGQLAREEDSGRRTHVDDLLKYYEMKKQRIDADDWKVKMTKDVIDLITAIFAIFSMMIILLNLSTRLWTLLHYSDNIYLELNHLIDSIFPSVSESCNNCITFVGLTFVFGKMSYILIYAINKFLNVAQPNFDNLKYLVEIFFVSACVEGGIIYADIKTRERNLEGVLLMTMFQIFLHTLGTVENEILALANEGGRTPPMRLMKLGLVLAAITVVPTYFVITHASPALHVNVWNLINLAGNLTLLVRVFYILVECFLLWISWHLTQLNDNIKRALNCVRVIKGFSILTTTLLMAYYRLMAPFLVAFFWLRVVSNIILVVFVIVRVIYIEWAKYKIRNELLDFISGLPNASQKEENTECSVCYIEMDAGKKLPCGHMFHHDCLKRWFHVRNMCPYCNTVVNIPRRILTPEGLVTVNQNQAGIEQ
ncbi:E3 ubiquitin-protein ligase RNF139-like [Mya arenaria]|uniref:E3 ubiquitin-protein ligase RNF139-like n=1 Tax=Mya arenaria TaxID=6604 RepID=UPI0022E42AD1|nr:E3 ubiquitin-protein ligase RNF139-like [Mya arenaria]